jgi:GT2 family glycosyltransferase
VLATTGGEEANAITRQLAEQTAGKAAVPPAGAYDADIVILALDRAEETVAAIHSALSQTGVAFHLFVIDQGSQPAALARIGAALNGRRDASLVCAGRNLGVAGGRNLGASLGHGRVIVALDNDAVFAGPHVLARAVAALDASPELGAIGFRIVTYADGRDDLTSWGYPGALLPCAAESFEAATFVGAGHAIRRAAWQDARGYDTALFFCWEEFDFCLRAIAAGWRIRYRGDLVVRHKVSPERRVTWSGERWFFFVRNRLYIARKWNAGIVALTPRMAAYLLKGTRAGLPGMTARAILSAWRMKLPPDTGSMPARLRSYLYQNDTAHRGHWMNRLRKEALARLAVEPARRAVAPAPPGRG